MAWRLTSSWNPIALNWARSFSGYVTDIFGQTSATSQRSIMPSPHSTRRNDGQARRSSALEHERRPASMNGAAGFLERSRLRIMAFRHLTKAAAAKSGKGSSRRVLITQSASRRGKLRDGRNASASASSTRDVTGTPIGARDHRRSRMAGRPKRMFSRIKQFRRIARGTTRANYRTQPFLAIATVKIWLPYSTKIAVYKAMGYLPIAPSCRGIRREHPQKYPRHSPAPVRFRSGSSPRRKWQHESRVRPPWCRS